MGFGPWGWDLDLKTGIWALRLGYGLRGWDMGLKGGGGKEEKNSPMWKHRSSTPSGPQPKRNANRKYVMRRVLGLIQETIVLPPPFRSSVPPTIPSSISLSFSFTLYLLSRYIPGPTCLSLPQPGWIHLPASSYFSSPLNCNPLSPQLNLAIHEQYINKFANCVHYRINLSQLRVNQSQSMMAKTIIRDHHGTTCNWPILFQPEMGMSGVYSGPSDSQVIIVNHQTIVI